MPNDHAGLPVPLAVPLSLSEYHARRQQPENRPLHDDADDLLPPARWLLLELPHIRLDLVHRDKELLVSLVGDGVFPLELFKPPEELLVRFLVALAVKFKLPDSVLVFAVLAGHLIHHLHQLF